jgi:hypothetical protein
MAVCDFVQRSIVSDEAVCLFPVNGMFGVGRECSLNVVARRAVQIFLPVMGLEPGRFAIVTTLTELCLMFAA